MSTTVEKPETAGAKTTAGTDTRNAGNSSRRKDVNSSRDGGNSRDFSQSRYSWDVNSSKNSSSMLASNSRDH